MNPETLEIRHDPAAKRFEADLECGQAYVAYERDEGMLDLLSTWVPPQHRGLGIGARLVVSALAHAREEGYRVIPTCPFVPDVIERHPEFADLVRGAAEAED